MNTIVGRPGEAEFLAEYDPKAFPAFAATVDLAIFTIRGGKLCVLVIERAAHPFKGYWALPGGHVHHGRENAWQAAVREFHEETGIDWRANAGHLEQLGTYTDPDRDPRITVGLHVVSVAHFALAPDLPDPHAGSDAANARWCAVAELDISGQRAAWEERLPYAGTCPTLAYDHADILNDALDRVRAKLEYTTLALQFVSEPFSLADLRRVYEAVWGMAPDLGNFRRKVLSTSGFVVPAERAPGSPTALGGRPPLLYRRGEARLLVPPLMRPASSGEQSADAENV